MLLTIFSTLTQPVFDDTEALSDTSSVGYGRNLTDSENVTDTFVLNQSRSTTDSAGSTDNTVVSQSKLFTDNETLTDTVLVTREAPASDSINPTDAFILDQSPTASDTETLTESVTLELSVVFTDGVGVTDDTFYDRVIQIFDDSDISDDSMVSFQYERIFDDTNTLSSDIAKDVEIVLDEGEFHNAIRFGHALGFGSFVFGSGNTFLTDNAFASREYTFTDAADLRDSFKTVKTVPALKITVEHAEIRWDLG